jgi:subtilisin family serine protease
MALSPTHSRPLSFLRRFLFAGVVSACLLALGLLGGRGGLEAGALWHEEATPDCGPVAPDTDPVQHRKVRLANLGVDRWHAAGIRGRGVKVAILDTGFRGYRAQLGKALPAQVTTHSFRPDGNMEARDSQHGILCAEVVHALAPDAEILLATWEPHSPEQFLQAAQWARAQGARVISCSVIMPSWSDGEGGGPVHAGLVRILGPGNRAGDMLCFASAGNTARRHWTGVFHDGGDGFHEWRSGLKDNRVRPWSSERVSIELCCAGSCRYRVQVYDDGAAAELGHSTSGGKSNCGAAIVRFVPESGHRYQVRVRLDSGTAQPFHLVALGGDLDCAMASGSIPFPGDGPEVVAVGAVDEEGRRLPYSSCGPNSGKPKPDLVAEVPFSTLWRERPFSGTSAAAPQAAGLAALCWALHPDWSADQIREALRRWARDLGPAGHDFETGWGLIGLPRPTAAESHP